MWPPQSPQSMNAFYGEPDAGRDGRADAGWMNANLVRVKPPYRMRWSWGGEVGALTIHRKCAPSLLRVLGGIAAHYGSQEAIENARMHLCGGAFNFRLKRGGSTLSIHSWGAAIDLDPERNAFGRRYRASAGMMPQPVIDLFAAEGWSWGGRWSRPDAMHFQAATVGRAPPASERAGVSHALIDQVFTAGSSL